MARRKVIIQLRCNEFAGRDANPHVPWSPQELAADAAAACAAGAAILHFHARTADGGASHDAAVYGDVIRRVRSVCDLIVNPTLGASDIADPLQRVAHIPILGQHPDTAPELAPVDLASVNIDPYLPGIGFLMRDLVYLNPVQGICDEIAAIQGAGARVDALLWNVGSARLLAVLMAEGVLQAPLMVELALSDLLLVTHPATERGLCSLLEFLPAGHTLPWTYLVNGGSALPLLPTALALGGHVSLGLGDHGYTEIAPADAPPRNADVVRAAVEIIRACGCEPASPAEAREILGLL
ncbi:MAG: 3-keto-5-aminohexanoate cleavage protein [Proteobacteria bacterium]|nr:3-keto-5-aminohexanoate cleavage protein [Pseudomonadota bacterium]HQR05036.1 3-keto-5-aminohexanoate cleavage protein [Rhodocyclaceae bacterium]